MLRILKDALPEQDIVHTIITINNYTGELKSYFFHKNNNRGKIFFINTRDYGSLPNYFMHIAYSTKMVKTAVIVK